MLFINRTVHFIQSALQSVFENYWKQTINTEYSFNSKEGKISCERIDNLK
jgi:hypothetical protein